MCLFVMRARGDSPQSGSFRFERFRDGHCDCDTVLGKDLFSVPRNLETEALRKKSWSDAKIKRAQEDSKKHAWVRQRGDGTTFEQDLAYWMKAIPKAVRADGWLGLLLYWDDNKEPCRFSRKQDVQLKDLSPEFLCSMERGVLYTFAECQEKVHSIGSRSGRTVGSSRDGLK